MAAFIRNSAILKLKNLAIPQASRCVRLISTSKKNSETATVTPTTVEDFADPSKQNWVSYGFEDYDQKEDSNITHATFFAAVSLCLVVGGVGLAYLPDVTMKDWACREGFLELRRRESLGLPLVDRNLIDPAKMVLPTDEELGDTEIII